MVFNRAKAINHDITWLSIGTLTKHFIIKIWTQWITNISFKSFLTSPILGASTWDGYSSFMGFRRVIPVIKGININIIILMKRVQGTFFIGICRVIQDRINLNRGSLTVSTIWLITSLLDRELAFFIECFTFWIRVGNTRTCAYKVVFYLVSLILWTICWQGVKNPAPQFHTRNFGKAKSNRFQSPWS